MHRAWAPTSLFNENGHWYSPPRSVSSSLSHSANTGRANRLLGHHCKDIFGTLVACARSFVSPSYSQYWTMGPGRTDSAIAPAPPRRVGGSDGMNVRRGETDLQISLDLPQPDGGSNGLDDHGCLERTWAAWMATACTITHVIGLEVLFLPWALAQLGWSLGPTVMFLFSFVACYTSSLWAHCHHSSLGGTKAKLYALVLSLNLFGVAIGCTIASSKSTMMAIGGSNCFPEKDDNSPCHKSNIMYMIAFAIIEIVLCQIPKLDQQWWFLTMDAVTPFAYLTIGLAFSIAKVAENGNFRGSLTGISIGDVSQTQKIWRVFQALGDIAFAYSNSMEIQYPSISLPSDARTTKKAPLVRVAVKSLICMLCGCVGYAAFGDEAPRNLLVGFGFFNPYWPIKIANAAATIHLICAYQVCSRRLFGFIEKRFEHSQLITNRIPVPGFRAYKLNVFQLFCPTLFVFLATVISVLLPFFNNVVGFFGALGFWTLTVYFPVEMHIAQMNIPNWSTKWLCLQILNVACLLITIAAAAGSIAGVVLDLKS
ncbi:hypothetical protein NL676_026265 [Syzygium grande]|nr:hypothetical protein NL676_026265 [Syzygium grande]